MMYFASNNSVILAMVVACLLPFVFAMLAKILSGFKRKDNENPRHSLATATGMAARANAVQQNSFESLPIFLASVLTALLFFVPLSVVAKLAWLYVVLRVVYAVAYVMNWATFRSLIWLLSMACPLLLFYIVIRLN
ncbi:MAPEG family protein [Faucicola boevrei]|uniref:MAPEG family protein n=1 Tax=Faucicola boevrei TaxID=346665 RepID=UPI00037AAC34